MSKITIVIEDTEAGVMIGVAGDNEFTMDLSKENTLAENLAVVATKTMRVNAEMWGHSSSGLQTATRH